MTVHIRQQIRNDRDVCMKIYVIRVDNALFGNYTIYAKTRPVDKLNSYLYNLELSDQQDVNTSKAHREKVIDYFKKFDFDAMSIGTSCFFERISITCVHLED